LETHATLLAQRLDWHALLFARCCLANSGRPLKHLFVWSLDILGVARAVLGSPADLHSMLSTSSSSQSDEDMACEVCGRTDDEDTMLICDGGCSRGYHTACVGLHSVPSGDWECEKCAAAACPEAAPRGAAAARGDGPPLSRGALRAIMNGAGVGCTPALQVVAVRDVALGHAASERCIYLELSDGEHQQTAVLVESLAPLVRRGELAAYAIVRVDAYSFRDLAGRRCARVRGHWGIRATAVETLTSVDDLHRAPCLLCLCARRLLVVQGAEVVGAAAGVLSAPVELNVRGDTAGFAGAGAGDASSHAQLPAAADAPRYTAVPPVPPREHAVFTAASRAAALLSSGSLRSIVREGAIWMRPVLQVLHIMSWHGAFGDDDDESAPLLCAYLSDGDDIVRGVLSETLSASAARGALPRHCVVRVNSYKAVVTCGVWCVLARGASCAATRNGALIVHPLHACGAGCSR
jgi:hypothetical protein